MERKWKKPKNYLLASAFLTLFLALLLPTAAVDAKVQKDNNWWGPSPPWISYKVTKNGVHIVQDPLVVASLLPTPTPGSPPNTPTSTPTISGWVIFKCSDDKPPITAPQGFRYFIHAWGLSPREKYLVRAYPQPGSADYGLVTYYNLGKLIANYKGEGGVNGFVNLAAGPFNYQVTVEKLDGTVVLEMLPPFTYWNPSLPWGPDLWYNGDLADGFVVK
jgi:hypothetical protein